MPKYVCAFDEVYTIGENICTAATELQNSITTYSTNIDSDLSGWEGAGAKTSFSTAKNDQVKSAVADCTYINEVGEFVKTCSKSIKELEDELANLSI